MTWSSCCRKWQITTDQTPSQLYCPQSPLRNPTDKGHHTTTLPPDLPDVEQERQLCSIDIETFSQTQMDPISFQFIAADMVLRYDGTPDNTHSTGRKLKIKWQGPFVSTSTKCHQSLQRLRSSSTARWILRLKTYCGGQS
jgi:hypothetical protein